MPALRRGTCFSLEPVSQVTRWQRDCARRNRYAARRPRARCNVNMTGFTTNRRERVLCCRYPGGRNRHTRFPVVLALRRGARRLDLSTPSTEGTDSLTDRPEGRRPGRDGGRQEYRHLSSLAQPSGFTAPPLDRVDRVAPV